MKALKLMKSHPQKPAEKLLKPHRKLLWKKQMKREGSKRPMMLKIWNIVMKITENLNRMLKLMKPKT